MSTPVRALNMAPARCCDEPTPPEPVVELAGRGLGGVDQLPHRLVGRLLGHFEDVGDLGDEGDGREVLDRVEAQTRVQVRVGGVGRAGGDQQGVAVGFFAHKGGGADVAAGAGLVVDDDGLAQAFGQALRQHAAQGVGGAARRPWHDQLDGTVGVGLGVGQRGEGGKCGECERGAGGAAQECVGHAGVSWRAVQWVRPRSCSRAAGTTP